MNNFIKITIYDNEGNCILNDSVSSPFVGLQTGETFWFGSDSNRTWAKVLKITYGFDTNLKCFVIEIVVELSEKKTTKVALLETTFIDHGEKRISGEYGGTWSINKCDIIVTVGKSESGYVQVITLQVNSPEGLIAKTCKDLHCGEFLEVITKERKITCMLISATWQDPSHATVRVTESKFIK